jgi:superfamily II helicase
MNINNLVYGAPVTMVKAESMNNLGHNKTAYEYQQSLRRDINLQKPAPKPQSKVCKYCFISKSLTAYRDHNSSRDGKCSKCRDCQNKIERERYYNKKNK